MYLQRSHHAPPRLLSFNCHVHPAPKFLFVERLCFHKTSCTHARRSIHSEGIEGNLLPLSHLCSETRRQHSISTIVTLCSICTPLRREHPYGYRTLPHVAVSRILLLQDMVAALLQQRMSVLSECHAAPKHPARIDASHFLVEVTCGSCKLYIAAPYEKTQALESDVQAVGSFRQRFEKNTYYISISCCIRYMY